MGALGGMRRNVEVKARLRAREETLGAALRLRGPCRGCPGAGQEPCQGRPGAGQGTGEGQEPCQGCPGAGQVLLQTDTFFRVPRGRLKLRRTQDGRGELIFYERPDSAGPKLSSFTITPTADPEGLQEVLAQSLGTLGTVTKERLLLLLGQTRLHLDRVQGLGDFLELEVVLRPEQSVEDGQRLARELLRDLGIGERDLVCGAYLDLLLARGQPQGGQGEPQDGQGQPQGGQGQPQDGHGQPQGGQGQPQDGQGQRQGGQGEPQGGHGQPQGGQGEPQDGQGEPQGGQGQPQGGQGEPQGGQGEPQDGQGEPQG